MKVDRPEEVGPMIPISTPHSHPSEWSGNKLESLNGNLSVLTFDFSGKNYIHFMCDNPHSFPQRSVGEYRFKTWFKPEFACRLNTFPYYLTCFYCVYIVSHFLNTFLSYLTELLVIIQAVTVQEKIEIVQIYGQSGRNSDNVDTNLYRLVPFSVM